MKKLLLLLLAAMLLVPCALADVTVESIPVENDAYLSKVNDYFYMRMDSTYRIFDENIMPVGKPYNWLITKADGAYFEYTGSGLNNAGILNAEGRVLTNPAYGDIYYVDADWVLGYVLEVTDAEAGDYSNRSTGEKYMVKRTDVFYQGKVIGSFTREELAPNVIPSVKGAYLAFRETSGTGFWLDRNFNITRIEKDFTYSEFTESYKKTPFHNPTQQYAFCEGCTLTADDVSETVWYNSYENTLVDLQGNVIKTGVKYDRVKVEGDWLLTREDDLWGLMDLQGNVIVEPAYDEIPYVYGVFNTDYQPALTPEGHLHFLNKQGQVVAKAEYELSASDYKGFSNSSAFAVVNNMGKYIVITAEAGELPTKYEEVSTPKSTSRLLSVKKDGLWGAIDLKGNVVIPFIHRYALDINNSCTRAYGQNEARERFLYCLTYSENAAPAVAATPIPASTPAPADENGWTCSCGSVNSGKFCPVCGAAKPAATPVPADDGSWTCACGSVNSGKFCPECGSPRPAADPQCANCGYKPEDEAPKFCPECGTKF